MLTPALPEARGGGVADHERQVTLRQMDHSRVEVGALLECGCNHRSGKRRGGLARGRVSNRAKVADRFGSFRISGEASLHRRTTPTASSSVEMTTEIDKKGSEVRGPVRCPLFRMELDVRRGDDQQQGGFPDADVVATLEDLVITLLEIE